MVKIGKLANYNKIMMNGATAVQKMRRSSKWMKKVVDENVSVC